MHNKEDALINLTISQSNKPAEGRVVYVLDVWMSKRALSVVLLL